MPAESLDHPKSSPKNIGRRKPLPIYVHLWSVNETVFTGFLCVTHFRVTLTVGMSRKDA